MEAVAVDPAKAEDSTVAIRPIPDEGQIAKRSETLQGWFLVH